MGFLREMFESEEGRSRRIAREFNDAFVDTVTSNDTAKAHSMLEDKASWRLTPETKNKALLEAAANNNPSLIEQIAKHNVRVAERLVPQKCDINHTGGIFYTRGKRSDGTTYTIEHPGATPLMYAAKAGAIDAVRKLIELGANLDAIMENGTSALMLSAENGRSDTVRVLLYAGADIHFRNKDNRRAVDLATDNRHFETHAILKAAHDKKPLPVIEAPTIVQQDNIVPMPCTQKINL